MRHHLFGYLPTFEQWIEIITSPSLTFQLEVSSNWAWPKLKD